MTRALRAVCLLSALVAATPASAHPHAFVEVIAGFDFDDQGRLSSIRVIWTYDAFSSLVLFDILDLDKDRDGKLNDEDRAAIVKGETDWADDYPGDTYLEMDDASVALARPANGEAWLERDRISVSFDLPLSAPLDVSGDVVLRFYDPYYYYAYEVVGLEVTLRNECLSGIDPFKADAASLELQRQLALLSQEETPDQDNVGRLFADKVWLRCD